MIGHEEVGPPVAVEIGRDDAHAPGIPAEGAGHPGPVLERAIPPVPEQEMALGGMDQGEQDVPIFRSASPQSGWALS